MANVLIVHAHPEPRSFSSALAHTAAEAFTAAGHQVAFSDLYTMAFDPVSSRANYLTVANPDYFKPQAEEHHATTHEGFVPLLDAEMRKLEACDLLVFSFPLWWFGLPAILKGWIDRVFAYGRIYGTGRWYDRGLGRGRRALAIMTTGSPATAYRRGGLHTTLETMLTPLHHGVFWFNGFSPLSPFVTWGPAHLTDVERAAALQALSDRLAGIWTEPVPTMPPVADYQPGTWVDQVPHFLVTARIKSDAAPATPLPSPQDTDALRELRRTGQLVRAMLTPSGSAGWQAAFEVRSLDSATALSLVRMLPLATACELACTPLDARQEDALSPYWAA